MNDQNDAHRLVTEIMSKLGAVDDLFESLRVRMQQCDYSVSKIYHEIEQATFGTVQAYPLAKKLQTALRERRLVKAQMEIAQSLKQTIDGNHIRTKIQRTAQLADGRMESLAQYTQGWGV